jgi:hypothetical protein
MALATPLPETRSITTSRADASGLALTDLLQIGTHDAAFDRFLTAVTKSIPTVNGAAPIDLSNVANGTQPAVDTTHDANHALGHTAAVPSSLYELEHVSQH